MSKESNMDRANECWDVSEHQGGTDSALWAIAAALFAIADAQIRGARLLGNGDAATSMGALEAFGLHIGDKIDRLAEAVERRGD